MSEAEASSPDNDTSLHGCPATETFGQRTVHADRARYLALMEALYRDGFEVCIGVTAVDYLTHPGRAPTRVTDFAAPDGTEQLCRAIDALDGALGLSSPGTARLLAIVSDTHYTEPEIAGGQRRITRLAKTGCGVIILQPDDPFPWGEKHQWADAQVITLTDPAGTIEVIARAATRALTA